MIKTDGIDDIEVGEMGGEPGGEERQLLPVPVSMQATTSPTCRRSKPLLRLLVLRPFKQESLLLSRPQRGRWG
jgi:hypothetical protein